MYPSNLVVLRGRVRTEPLAREVASGRTVVQFDLTTQIGGGSVSVPVAVHDQPADCREGDEVLVVGHVHRRFFRFDGRTQSRTEVVASTVLRTSRRRTVDKALAAVAAALDPAV